MGRFARYLNTVLNAAFIVLAAAVAVLAVLSLVKGPTLRYAPYLFGAGALYYLGTAVMSFLQEGRRRALKGVLLLLLALSCAAMTFVSYRALA